MSDDYVSNRAWLRPAGRPDAIDEVADAFERPSAAGSEAFWRAELEMRQARRSTTDAPVAYRTRVASIEGGTLQTHVGLPVVVERLDALENEPIDTIIVAGTFVADQMVLDAQLVKWLERPSGSAARESALGTPTPAIVGA